MDGSNCRGGERTPSSNVIVKDEADISIELGFAKKSNDDQTTDVN